ncbi:hypothetical protein BC940DRAFT_317952 [Gongronella butleri]|nr:hypothetical protein BC940DRAFT_317952 [Gongronella butleri]
MASEDIISQLRDLQSVIDDFELGSENYNQQRERQSKREKHNSLMDTLMPFQSSDSFADLVDKINEIQPTLDDVVLPSPEDATSLAIDGDVQAENAVPPASPAMPLPSSPPSMPPSVSQPSLGSEKRSIKSHKSTRTRRADNAACKYYARSYEEMMYIPDISERIRFYEKTYQQCMAAPSVMYAWVQRMKAKGKPTPLCEGYTPPPRPVLVPSGSSVFKGRVDHGSLSFNGSISMVFRKATRSEKRSNKPERLASQRDRLAQSMHWTSSDCVAPRPVQGMMGSSRVTPMTKAKTSKAMLNTSLLSLKKRAAPPPVASDEVLTDMCSVLPQLDRMVLNDYLAQANGDPMVAITMAVSHLKK